MSEITELTLAALRDALQSKKLTAIEATDAYLDRIKRAGALNAFISVTGERARDMAKRADEKLAKGENVKQYVVALPCEPEQFSSFISSLLGKPQTISKGYTGSFEITHQDIQSAYRLVCQRVSQQNQGTLIQFSVRLVFDDNSTVLLNSFEDFLGYTEVRPLVVTQAHLSWSFLVKFEDREHPEKQEIDLSFVASGAGGVLQLG